MLIYFLFSCTPFPLEMMRPTLDSEVLDSLSILYTTMEQLLIAFTGSIAVFVDVCT